MIGVLWGLDIMTSDGGRLPPDGMRVRFPDTSAACWRLIPCTRGGPPSVPRGCLCGARPWRRGDLARGDWPTPVGHRSVASHEALPGYTPYLSVNTLALCRGRDCGHHLGHTEGQGGQQMRLLIGGELFYETLDLVQGTFCQAATPVQAHGLGPCMDCRRSISACWLTFRAPSCGRSRSAMSPMTAENVRATARTASDLLVPTRPA